MSTKAMDRSRSSSVTEVRAAPVPRRIVDLIASYLAYAIVSFVFLLPFTWLVLTSFKPTNDVFRYTYPLTVWTFLPPAPTLENYVSIFATWGFHRDLANTLIAAA